MRIALFVHSLLSDWNHGNAHFIRGVASALIAQGHKVDIWEAEDSWSLSHLRSDYGEEPIRKFGLTYPELATHFYTLEQMDLDRMLYGVDLVIIHEWSQPELVARIGEHRAAQRKYIALFHDTHHRSVTAPAEMARYDLRHYDGVLAFGNIIRDLYIRNGWTHRAWTWHEAADVKRFFPQRAELSGDLVWIGNWGDDERTEQLREFLIEPVKRLGLRAAVYGVRYPPWAIEELKAAGIEYRGWVANFEAPSVFAQYLMTVHVPRRPYTQALPGIPTIRVFEALACGIPMVSAPWSDAEHLFTPGEDFLTAKDGEEMTSKLRRLREDGALRKRITEQGRATILERHTCVHRANELVTIYREARTERHASIGS